MTQKLDQSRWLWMALFVGLTLLSYAVTTAPVLVSVLDETLNIDSLLNPDQLFGYANLILVALGGLVAVILGFKLAGIVIRFLLAAFDGLRF